MITAIAFTVYPVKDMAKAREFYESVLGLKLTQDYQGQWVEYDLGDSTFALTNFDMKHVPGAKGAIIAFEASDVELLARELKEKSVTFVLELTTTPVCRMAVIQDPDGNDVIIHQRNK